MLKGECVERHDFQTPEQARACIFEHLEIFYDWEGRPRSPGLDILSGQHGHSHA
jgi:hypothetical protein